MTIAAWLRERVPAPPPRLAARIEEVLAGDLDAPGAEVAPRCVAAAERLLRELAASPSAGRESALDLLVVDALATYAFEAASDDPTALHERALDAARRFASAASALAMPA